MKIRMKLFIILLIFSLVPLLAIADFGRRGIRKLGRAVHEKTTSTLATLACESLLQTSENSAKMVKLSKQSLEYALSSLAYEAERILAEDSPGIPGKMYLSEDYDNASRAPADFAPSSRYLKKKKEGLLEPASISMNHPVFYLAPGISQEAVKEDMARLVRLTPTFRNIFPEFKNLVYWMYVSFESGIHLSYPGHGGYPASYDPRVRPWYQGAKDRTGWVPPIVDATSERVILTACRRIYGPDGSMIGVAALDVLMTDVLQESELLALWSSKMNVIFVAMAPHPETQKPGLRILAQKDYQDKAGSWKSLVEFEWLTAENPDKLQTVIEDLKEKKSGYVDMPYNGIESFWAYSPISEDTHFILAVPKSVVMTLPGQAAESVDMIIREQRILAAIDAAVVLIVVIAAALIISNRITRPMMEISQAADRLSRGDFSVRINLHTGDERDQVADAFNEMVPKLEDHLRIHRSLNFATEVQQRLLPQITPRVAGLDIAGTSIYCDETGGDYFDYLNFENPGCISVIIGDVADHGVPSALLMASARALIRQRSTQPGKIAEIMSDVNRQMSLDVSRSGQFMTLIYMTIDRQKEQLLWVRAGHDPAILYDPAADVFEQLRGSGIAVGIDEKWQYEENERTGIAQGQIILLGTDGIWEARNPSGKMFGKGAVYDVIRNHAAESADRIMNAIIDAVNRFQGAERPEDDVTIIVIKIVETPLGNNEPA
jgi:sigma-B regulation protein RsbU (phosphoserine phosphatase)